MKLLCYLVTSLSVHSRAFSLFKNGNYRFLFPMNTNSLRFLRRYRLIENQACNTTGVATNCLSFYYTEVSPIITLGIQASAMEMVLGIFSLEHQSSHCDDGKLRPLESGKSRVKPLEKRKSIFEKEITRKNAMVSFGCLEEGVCEWHGKP